MTTLRKLADGLGVDPAELVGEYPLHIAYCCASTTIGRL
jgi:hypothetical protein